MIMKAPRGTKDVLPADSYKWQYLENLFRETCKEFGYKEIRTPIFEHTELFERGVGETTDVVQKEMYTFEDRGGRSITLKPEGTASVVRAYVENKLFAEPQPTKVFYITPVLRYERPQKGRLREHHQFGVEVFGSNSASIDAEVISLVWSVYRKLGIEDIELNINSVGCPKCRKEYNEILKNYLSNKLENLCQTCQVRYEKNPMRIIDCKNEKCQYELKDVPLMIDYLCDECKSHFEQLKDYLSILNINFIVNPKIVRGLDYYTKTAFEFISTEIGAKSTVCGGGRYDGLVEEIGGPSTPGVGFGMGIERLLLTLENKGIEIPKPKRLEVFLIAIGENAEKEAFKILYNLRKEGISSEKDHLGRSIKAQFKYANKLDAKFTLVLGEDELNKGLVKIKNMDTGQQIDIKIEDISKFIKEQGGNR
ncbi:histidyl-tRNA synthetase [Caloranaerobacter sp. TR13]|uniref:histidine--tRNA ligase n=1 Tax=Caloranaerobacter sp. TR13 TaxID=1302151 RepID=UPI0006D3B9CC|nr:histidine--tRNA ligase [Caloranaerobacter sp. TR13]KPU28021.1 histidyl-tRNA synthetase [Caloranaerobacter sp. TR13]